VIPTDDRGLTLGDGLFETVLARSGELVLFGDHMQRMAAGAAALGLPPPDMAQAAELAAAAVSQLGAARAAVRLTYTAGSGGRGLDRPPGLAPRLFATAAPSQPPDRPARLALSPIRRNPASPTSRHKTLSYLDSVLARREATLAGADEALILDTAGRVASAAAANLFWIVNGRLETPGLECGVLPGIMRAQVLGAAVRLGIACAECAVPPAHLLAAQGVFLTNSLIGVRAVERIDGAVMAGHPLVARLAAAVSSAT
jgi:branched-chain amino acid aminotransferase/4-amino-4-deoxychorismate lyase